MESPSTSESADDPASIERAWAVFINNRLLDAMESLGESMDEVEDATAPDMAPDMASMGEYLASEAGGMRDTLARRLAAQEGVEAPMKVTELIEAAERAKQAGTDAHEACAGDVSGSRATEECQSAFTKAVNATSELYRSFDWVIAAV